MVKGWTYHRVQNVSVAARPIEELVHSNSATACGSTAQELCESRGGRPGLPVPNSPYGLCGRLCGTVSVDVKQHWRTELRSCVEVEVTVLGSPSLIVLMVSVDVKQHWTWSWSLWRSLWLSGRPNNAGSGNGRFRSATMMMVVVLIICRGRLCPFL